MQSESDDERRPEKGMDSTTYQIPTQEYVVPKSMPIAGVPLIFAKIIKVC